MMSIALIVGECLDEQVVRSETSHCNVSHGASTLTQTDRFNVFTERTHVHFDIRQHRLTQIEVTGIIPILCSRNVLLINTLHPRPTHDYESLIFCNLGSQVGGDVTHINAQSWKMHAARSQY